jgi:hypothetical protein
MILRPMKKERTKRSDIEIFLSSSKKHFSRPLDLFLVVVAGCLLFLLAMVVVQLTKSFSFYKIT